MNNSTNLKKLSSGSNQSKPDRLILAAYLSLQRLNRSKYQLEQIADGHPASATRKEAATYLQKNEKLVAITVDLIDRLKRFSETDRSAKIDESLSQIRMELEMLDDMHFEVAKIYSPFIYHHYESTIISMNNQFKQRASVE